MGLSQPGVDRKSVAVLYLDVPQIAELGLASPALLVQPRASGSVVDWWVALERRSPWKSIVGLSGVIGRIPGYRLLGLEALERSPRLALAELPTV
jgi:hypothetical protein